MSSIDCLPVVIGYDIGATSRYQLGRVSGCGAPYLQTLTPRKSELATGALSASTDPEVLLVQVQTTPGTKEIQAETSYVLDSDRWRVDENSRNGLGLFQSRGKASNICWSERSYNLSVSFFHETALLLAHTHICSRTL